tara:strand:+ start:417 stop:743 length:327 start_codon:yes stop_codon:yes gene_type:complete
MREESVKILRENDNLDLNTYKPFMQEFYKFSGDMFDFESNIFQAKKKDPTQVKEDTLRRSLKNEYRLAEKELKIAEGGAPSPERINKLLKQYPPFALDNIPDEDITSF